jgi:dephospho-CoA kinase
MIIGITGSMACGKEAVSRFFIDKGFEHNFLSKELREELKERGIEISRANLQNLGDELRVKEGNGFLAKRMLKRLGKGNFIIDGIRNPGEVEEFRKEKDFILIAIDADQKIRYERSISRSKTSDAKTWEEFLKMDKRDFGTEEAESGQQVEKCMALADFKIINNTNLEDLYTKLDELYSKIKC